MYIGYRNKARSHETVRAAIRGGGISERKIIGAESEQEGRVVKIFTKLSDNNFRVITNLLTLVQQPGHEPRAFVQETIPVGSSGWPVERKPTGDFTPLEPSEALSLVFKSDYKYLDYAGKSVLRNVIDFFPVALNPELHQQ